MHLFIRIASIVAFTHVISACGVSLSDGNNDTNVGGSTLLPSPTVFTSVSVSPSMSTTPSVTPTVFTSVAVSPSTTVAPTAPPSSSVPTPTPVSVVGADLYQQHCANCHGATPYNKIGSSTFNDTTALAAYIHSSMPQGNVSLCQETCARELASYLSSYLVDVQSADVYSEFVTMNQAGLYRKASQLLTGTLPSNETLVQVSTQEAEAFSASLRNLMTGENFNDFLMEGANDQLLVRKWRNGETPGLDSLFSEYHFPEFRQRFDAVQTQVEAEEQAFEALCDSHPEGSCSAPNTSDIPEIQSAFLALEALRAFRYQTYQRINAAIADAPLRLIVEVVNNEESYANVLTADYIMMNPYSGSVYDPEYSFTDPNDENEWVRGQIKSMAEQFDDTQWGGSIYASNYPDALPMAGILTTPAFLGRYPTTETNRNRARARWAYYFFMGTDIEALAQRPMASEDLQDTNNPTLNNPSCAVCHNIMDPVAGTFQAWSDNSIYKNRQGIDSLPWNYIWPEEGERIYQHGDLWYRDNRVPGFEGALMPSLGAYKAVQNYDDGLQWLAEQFTADERFATAAVQFWWPALFGNKILAAPVDQNDANYQSRLQAWSAQQALIAELAETFKASGLNLKDLFVAMLQSTEFAGAAYRGHLSDMSHIGLGRLLTPEQLNRKMIDLSGYRWTPNWNLEQDYLLSDYYALFGGIDSDTSTVRPEAINTLMSAVSERMAMETSCTMVFRDLEKAANHRLLLPLIEVESVPNNTADNANIRANIHYLIERFWGVEIELDDAEVDAAYQLFVDVWTQRMTWFNDESKPGNWGEYLNYNDDNNAWDEHCYALPHFDWQSVDWSNPRATLGNYYNPEQTVRSWAAVMVYLMTDAKFIFE